MLRRAITVCITLVALLAPAAPSAVAGGNGAATDTVTVKDAPMTLALTDFCHANAPALLTATLNGVLHETTAANGSTHVTGTLTGPATLATVAGAYAGRITLWFGGNTNGRSENFTATASFTGGHVDTGERLQEHFVGHATLNARGEPTASFERGYCRGPVAA